MIIMWQTLERSIKNKKLRLYRDNWVKDFLTNIDNTTTMMTSLWA